ncbi:polysaccharide deacetylase family protein [Luteimonas sp. RIT-PG2_3]
MKRDLAAKVLASTGLRDLLAFFQRPHGVLILNYHRIGDGSQSPYDRELWSASASAFDEQVAFLARHCDVISPADLDHALAKPRGRHVMITFDDGYRDNYELAFPVLRAHKVPATFFVTTGFIDKPTLPWWDEIAALLRNTSASALTMAPWFRTPLLIEPGDRARPIRQTLEFYKTLPAHDNAAFLAQLRAESQIAAPCITRDHWMDWDMIREMHANGMTIGGHTVHHPVLARMPREQQLAEIAGCRARINAELGAEMSYFAYPVGGRDAFNADTWACLEDQGVRHAFSYYGGFATCASTKYDMPRVAIETSVGTDLFRAMTRLPGVFCRRAYT